MDGKKFAINGLPACAEQTDRPEEDLCDLGVLARVNQDELSNLPKH